MTFYSPDTGRPVDAEELFKLYEERDRLKSELTAARDEAEKAQAKASLFRRACEDLLDERALEQALILRKQAEAIEKFAECLSGTRNKRLAQSEVDRLRLEAEELEKAGGGS